MPHAHSSQAIPMPVVYCPDGIVPEPRQNLKTPEAPSTRPSCKISVPERDALYAEFAPLVRRLLRQYGQDPEFKKDLAGEIYCRFCALLNAYDPSRGIPLRPYLVRQLSAAIYTYARHQWRRARREVVWDTQPAGKEAKSAQDPTRQWDQSLAVAQVVSALPEALSQLSLRQRQVVLWRYYQSRSFEEIATLLGVEVSTARSLLRHGLNKLRTLIGPNPYPEE